MDRAKRKSAQNMRIHINLHMRKVASRSFIHSVASNDSVSGHGRPRSDCVDAQAGLGLRCPHMSEDTFSRGAVKMI